MVDKIIFAAEFFGVIVMLFYTPALMLQGILKMEMGELSKSEKLLSFIPVYNVAKAENMYTGRISTVLLSELAFALTILIRLLVVFTIPGVYVVQLITVVLFLISVVAILVTNMYFVFMIIHDCEVVSLPKALLFAIAFPIGQYYIGSFLPNIIKNLAKREDTFK